MATKKVNGEPRKAATVSKAVAARNTQVKDLSKELGNETTRAKALIARVKAGTATDGEKQELRRLGATLEGSMKQLMTAVGELAQKKGGT